MRYFYFRYKTSDELKPQIETSLKITQKEEERNNVGNRK